MQIKRISTSAILMMLSLTIIFSSQRIPLNIKSQDKIFQKLSKQINNTLPKNIEILIYKFTLLNGKSEL